MRHLVWIALIGGAVSAVAATAVLTSPLDASPSVPVPVPTTPAIPLARQPPSPSTRSTAPAPSDAVAALTARQRDADVLAVFEQGLTDPAAERRALEQALEASGPAAPWAG